MRIFVAGHLGMVGSAIVRKIENDGKHEWFGEPRSSLDLLNRNKVHEYVAKSKPDAIIIAAAKVGGILANNREPVAFLSENLQIQTNLIDAAHKANIDKLLFLGSSCIYPKYAAQPIHEESLLSGPLEPTNEYYAIAKIAGLKLVQAYRKQYGHNWISMMPTNLYGPGDNFDEMTSHVIPGMITKFRLAMAEGSNQVVLWGSGTPLREFLYVDDLAAACLFCLENYDGEELLNVGSGEEVSIAQVAKIISGLVGFGGEIVWDTSIPDGTPRKRLDIGRLSSLGWRSNTLLQEGISDTLSSLS